MKLTEKQIQLHETALKLCETKRRIESQIVEVLVEIDTSKLYRHFGCTSLFQYCVSQLGLSESVAYSFITVARKISEVPELQAAIQGNELSVSKASRLAPALRRENALEMIDFAKRHSSREIDNEVAKRTNKDPMVQLKIKKSTLVKLKRASEVLAQKAGKSVDSVGALEAVLEDFLERHDPVRKAARAGERRRVVMSESAARQSQSTKTNNRELRPVGVGHSPSKLQPRKKLAASLKHQVFQRDNGQCTFRDAKNQRCTNRQWLHIHHIKSKALGGEDTIENLTTLCSNHHDLVHQLSLPIEGEVTWLRDRRRAYG